MWTLGACTDTGSSMVADVPHSCEMVVRLGTSSGVWESLHRFLGFSVNITITQKARDLLKCKKMPIIKLNLKIHVVEAGETAC